MGRGPLGRRAPRDAGAPCGACGALPAIDTSRECAALDDDGRAARTLPAFVATISSGRDARLFLIKDGAAAGLAASVLVVAPACTLDDRSVQARDVAARLDWLAACCSSLADLQAARRGQRAALH